MISTKFERLIKIKKGALHIGGNVGEERFWYKNNGFNKVIWFEPILNSYNTLLKNIESFPNQTAFNVGIYSETKEMPLHISSNGGASSSILSLGLHKIYHPHVSYVRDEIVKLIRMDEFIMKNNIDISEFNMLNVDVQGTELQVFESFGKLIDGFDYILTEVNVAEIYENCTKMVDIDNYLENYNFIRVETYMTPYQWGDAFYIKKNLV